MADTGWKVAQSTPTSISSTPYDDNGWTTPANGAAEDAAFTYVTAASFDTGDFTYLLRLAGFACNVPVGATIDGVEVRVKGYEDSGEGGGLAYVALHDSGTVLGTAKNPNIELPVTTNAWMTSQGGATDKWGASLTQAIVNGSGFGVQIAIEAYDDNADVYIDSVQLKVYYTTGAQQYQQTCSKAAAVVPTISRKLTLKRAYSVAAAIVPTAVRKTKKALSLSGAETLTQTYESSNRDDYCAIGWYSGYLQAAVAEGITGAGGGIKRIKWWMGYTGTPSGNIVAKVYEYTGTWPDGSVGSLLGTSGEVAAPTTGSWQWVEFTFATPVQTVNGTHYFISIEAVSTFDSSNVPWVGLDASTPSWTGNQQRIISGTWQDPTQGEHNRDAMFEVYEAGTGVAVIASVTYKKVLTKAVSVASAVVATVSRKTKHSTTKASAVVPTAVRKTKHSLSKASIVVPTMARKLTLKRAYNVTAVVVATSWRRTKKSLAIAAAASPTATRKTKKVLAATATVVPLAFRKTARAVSVTVTAVASVVANKLGTVLPSLTIKTLKHVNLTTASVASVVAQKLAGVYYQTVSVASSVVPTVTKKTRHALSKAATVVATMSRKASLHRTFTKASVVVASVNKRTKHSVSKAASAVATVATQVIHGLYTQTVSVTTAVVATMSRKLTLKRAYTATATVTATVNRRIRHAMSKASAAVATVNKRTRHSMTKASAVVPTARRKTLKQLSKTATVVATVTLKQTLKRAFTATASAVATTSKKTRKAFSAVASVVATAIAFQAEFLPRTTDIVTSGWRRIATIWGGTSASITGNTEAEIEERHDAE